MAFLAKSILRTGLAACLVSAALFPALAGGTETLRYFQYYTTCGEKAPVSGPYKNVSFSLSGGKISIFLSAKDKSDAFAGPVPDGETTTELSRLVSRLSIPWEIPLSEAQCGKMSSSEKEKICRWHLTMLFEPAGPGQRGKEIRLDGGDDGNNPGRLAAQKAFTDFFASKLAALQKSAPKHIRNALWTMPRKGERVMYSVSAEDDGRVRISRHAGGKRLSGYADPAILDALQNETRKAKADAWHGFREEVANRDPARAELHLNYDTQQSVFAMGTAGREKGLPEGFLPLLEKLCAACDALLDASEPAPARNGALQSFSFSQSNAMAGSRPGYRLYRRMDKNGPVMVLERENGLEQKASCLVNAKELLDFERLLDELDIAKWNGFKGSDPRVLDGTSFSLAIRWGDGREADAGGYMRFPEGYREKTGRIAAFLDGILKKNGGSSPR